MTQRPMTVMIAEDDELTRTLAAEFLADNAFEIIEAEHADAALAALNFGPGASMSYSLTSRCRAQWVGSLLPISFMPTGLGSESSLCQATSNCGLLTCLKAAASFPSHINWATCWIMSGN